jgi:alpha-glucuronidase
MMMMSRETVVDYMTPLGLHHIMGTSHHHGPAPWVDDLERPDWNPVYYHRADRNGIGFNRTASGSNALEQYAPEIARQYADPRTTPEQLLLWFHHLPWTTPCRPAARCGPNRWSATTKAWPIPNCTHAGKHSSH